MASDFDDQTPGGFAPPGPSGCDPIAEALAALGSVLKSVADVPATLLTDEAALADLESALRVRSGIEELTARLVRTISDRDLPRSAGASLTRAWLTSLSGLSTTDAARLVSESKAHPGDPDGISRDARLEPTRTAWASGDLSAERAVVLSDTMNRLDPGLPVKVTDAVQADLVAQSPTLGYADFRRLCAHTVEVVDPDQADALLEAQLAAQEKRALQNTAMTLRRVGDGTTRLSGLLPDLQADMFRAALDGYSSPRRLSRTNPDNPYLRAPEDDGSDELTYPQRLGRAFLELLEHLPTDALPSHGVNPATVVVTMTLEQLQGALGETTLDTGTVLSAGQARRLACNTKLIPAVLGGNSAVLDLGAGQRLFSRGQRIALALRDGGCVFPGCDRRPAWCEAHHITPWSHDGPTDQANGCLPCPFHHHLIHAGEWAVAMAADGAPEIIPPPRIDPQRTPRRQDRLTRPARC